MYAIIGIVVLLVMVFGGFTITGGALGPVLEAIPHEMMIIGGAAAGALIAGNSMHGLKALGAEVLVHFMVDAPPVLTEDTRELVGAQSGPMAQTNVVVEDLERAAEIGMSTFVARLDPRTTAAEHQKRNAVKDAAARKMEQARAQWHDAMKQIRSPGRMHVFVRYAVAQEVTQDTWLAVVRGVERFEGRSSFKTWLFRILGNRARSAVRREARAGRPDDTVDGRFDVAALRILRIARQAALCFLRRLPTREDGDAVPALLAVPDRAIARRLQGFLRKLLLRRLELLQADDVWTRLFQPAQ